MKKHRVQYVTTKNPDVIASIMERLNRTLKQRMWKYFTKYQTYHYLNVLPQLVNAYNHSRHSSIKMAPAQVSEHNLVQVWHNQYDKKTSRAEKQSARLESG